MKKGQVTIFIIVGILIVAVILLFLIFSGERESKGANGKGEDPNSFLETCLEDSVRDKIRELGLKGGKADPEFSMNFMSQGLNEKIRYLCYTSEDNKHCVNQDPLIFQTFEQELKKELSEKVDSCFFELQKSLEKKGFVVEGKNVSGDFDLKINRVSVDLEIDGELALTRNDESTTKKDFSVVVPSGLFKVLIFPVQEILRKESSSLSCEFDVAGYSLFYPEYSIKKHTTWEGVEIYTVEYKKTGEVFRFAVRSCIRPGGYGYEPEK